ncbi:MAG TPA: protein-glutamate O-methyltransferase CheR [Gemmatimonadales bacterium]|nr:protein-glutamate O-methyltransferase CheR [Gemmatimonadales bacterium]
MTELNDPGFERLSRRILQFAGFTTDAYKPRVLRRRIAVRMRANNVHTYEEYLAILDRAPEEYQKLADALTINVTKFFRNPELWARMRELVIPELWKILQRPITVWSAGCASGEEPYTLAMLFAQARGPLDRIRIDATDIDRVCLERASAGVYPMSVFSETPAEIVEAYTTPLGEGRQVVPRLREIVAVNRLDLTREAPRNPPYDMIVCRNVLIYFDRVMQERLFAIFADSLRAGGFLVLGKVETIMGPTRERLEMVDPRERIYRRPA